MAVTIITSFSLVIVKVVTKEIYNNYSPKWRWLVLAIYRGRDAGM